MGASLSRFFVLTTNSFLAGILAMICARAAIRPREYHDVCFTQQTLVYRHHIGDVGIVLFGFCSGCLDDHQK